MNLFDCIDQPPLLDDWKPDTLPSLDGVHEISLDCETNGLEWWEQDRPVGFAVTIPIDGQPIDVKSLFSNITVSVPPVRTQYIPFGHRGGGNLPEERVREWAQRELRGKRITNLNTRFDIHMMREWGVDLEAQGNEVSDVGHYAALLDDHRLTFNQQDIVRDWIGNIEEKVLTVNGIDLDGRRMADYHAKLVAVRAEADVRQVHILKHVMWEEMNIEDLHRVRALEDDVIFPVCEMEKNGARVDLELLAKWTKETEQLVNRLILSIYNDIGIKLTGERKNLEALFHKLGLEVEHTAGGTPSFTGAILKRIDHPVIQKVLRIQQLNDLRSRYLLKYPKSIDSRGVLRYALHQLRTERAEGGYTGTVSGRFSSTGLTRGFGINVQQVMKSAKQRVAFGFDEKDDSHDDEIFIIRQLHVPESGEFLSADAMQIEYRIFASETNSDRLINVYKAEPRQDEHGNWVSGPLASFHHITHQLLKQHKPDLTYRRNKDLNFATIYGAGLFKKALMLGFITQQEFEYLKALNNRGAHPLLQETLEVQRIYDREIPEVKPLLEKAANLAETRGFIRTVLGRRSRFPNGQRSHKALNARIQGTAADIMKRKLVELHRERKHTGFVMRYTVHDEVDGDVPNQESADRVSEVLNDQSFFSEYLRVPILWDVSTGKNWKECA